MRRPKQRADVLRRTEECIAGRSSKRVGDEIVFRCPIPGHEDRHPSCRWNPKKRTFFCDPCRTGGGYLDLARLLGIRVDKSSRSQSTDRLQQYADGCHAALIADDAVLEQIATTRCLTADTIKRAGVGFDRKAGAVTIPFCDDTGAVKYVKLRRGGLDAKAAYLVKPSGHDKCLFGLQLMEQGPVVVAEGEFDALVLRQEGINAVSIPNGVGSVSNGRPAWLRPLDGREVTICLDSDEAGRKASAKLAGHLGSARVARLPTDIGDAYDVTDFARLGRMDLVLRAIDEAESIKAEGEDRPESALAQLKALSAEATPVDVEPVLRQLARELENADELARATAREAAIGLLSERGFRSPAGIVDAALAGTPKPGRDGAGASLEIEDPEPWDDPVSGEQLLNEICEIFKRYVIFPEGGAQTAAIWAVQTYCIDAFDIAPILQIKSPEKRCGKTTLLDLLAVSVRRPILAASISPAAVFRSIEKWEPTLLIDEADAFMGGKEELRGILNAGHRRGGSVVRTAGDDHEPRLFDVFSPKAIAAIDDLPDTIEDRSIQIQLKRRLNHERVERFRRARVELELADLKRKATRWAQDYIEALAAADPSTPGELNDRAADSWRPLLAIADVAGGEWPALARAAAQASIGEPGEGQAENVKIMLLEDLQEIFLEAGMPDAMTTAAILEKLHTVLERPWAEYGFKEKPLSPKSLGQLLRGFEGVRSKQLWIGGQNVKGYEREPLDDAWERYLSDASEGTTPPPHPENDDSSARGARPLGAHRETQDRQSARIDFPSGSTEPGAGNSSLSPDADSPYSAKGSSGPSPSSGWSEGPEEVQPEPSEFGEAV